MCVELKQQKCNCKENFMIKQVFQRAGMKDNAANGRQTSMPLSINCWFKVRYIPSETWVKWDIFQVNIWSIAHHYICHICCSDSGSSALRILPSLVSTQAWVHRAVWKLPWVYWSLGSLIKGQHALLFVLLEWSPCSFWPSNILFSSIGRVRAT